jgi:hypothetical protein
MTSTHVVDLRPQSRQLARFLRQLAGAMAHVSDVEVMEDQVIRETFANHNIDSDHIYVPILAKLVGQIAGRMDSDGNTTRGHANYKKVPTTAEPKSPLFKIIPVLCLQTAGHSLRRDAKHCSRCHHGFRYPEG